jgi:hypothetical protein
MAENVLKISGALDLDKKRLVVEQRRCILLAIIGSTPDTNPTMKAILSNGFLDVVKSWLDDILNGAIGASTLLVARARKYRFQAYLTFGAFHSHALFVFRDFQAAWIYCFTFSRV